MRKGMRWALIAMVLVFAVAVVAAQIICMDVAVAKSDDKDASKGKSDDKGKSDESSGKSEDKGKSAPSAPELPGIAMVLTAAGTIGGGYWLRKRSK